MTLSRRGRAALVLAPLLLASACASSADDVTGPEVAAEAPLQIVSTVAPITSIVANIAGDRAQIIGVVPEGTNSHTFEPPPQVSSVMEKADVVFVNGLQLEEPTFELAEENAPEDATIVKVGDEVLPESDYIKEIARIVDQVRERKVRVIFGSEVFPSAVLEQIANETGARYEDTLRDDDLPGKPGDPQHSWLGLMRYDYVTTIEGLGGTTTKLDALDVSDVAPDTADYPQ